MALLTPLLVLPLALALIFLVLPASALRDLLVRLGALAVMALSIAVAVVWLPQGSVQFEVHLDLHYPVLGAGLLIALYLLFACRKVTRKELYIPLLILAQTGLILAVELSGRVPHVHYPLYLDSLSILMILIIGVVGGLIAIYAVSYMRAWHEHHGDQPDRRRVFFFTFFLFLAGMFGVVVSNHLSWLFLCWEITTLCSFLLIGYGGDNTSTRNAFRALGLNLMGGVAFAGALYYLTFIAVTPTLALDEVIALGPLALIPGVLIAFAGLTKSAQMPFSSWLLGAMVAPTPVSALLHSSTMVKAGVFIIIKLAPVYAGSLAGDALALVGGITFLMTSLLAVSQSNAKRVLAYSTIANLGLIVMCAGVGTPTAIWAAILLVVFHAVAKALLFLGVGTTEHALGSRDIEDMEGLIARRPLLGVVMAIGILGMFVAPFGMLLSKYASLLAILGASPILALLLAFGSAPTLFFWSKWLGKLVSSPHDGLDPVPSPSSDERLTLNLLAAGTFLSTLLFPLIALVFINPYLEFYYGYPPRLDPVILGFMLAMLALFFLMPLCFLLRPVKPRPVDAYMAGINVQGSGHFRGTLDDTRKFETSSYYLRSFFPETRLTQWSVGLTILTCAAMLLAAVA